MLFVPLALELRFSQYNVAKAPMALSKLSFSFDKRGASFAIEAIFPFKEPISSFYTGRSLDYARDDT